MKIYLGADHRGYKLKKQIKDWLVKKKYEYEDLGNEVYNDQDDYTDVAVRVGEAVGLERESRGILMCSSGAGMDLTVNKIKGIRGVLGFDVNQVKESVEKDGVNVLSLPAKYVSLRQAKKIIEIFLESEFRQEEKYLRRIKKIYSFEQKKGAGSED